MQYAQSCDERKGYVRYVLCWCIHQNFGGDSEHVSDRPESQTLFQK